MKTLTTVILDKSLIHQRDLIDILHNEGRREELLELLLNGRVAIYTHYGHRVGIQDFVSANAQGMSFAEGSLAS